MLYLGLQWRLATMWSRGARKKKSRVRAMLVDCQVVEDDGGIYVLSGGAGVLEELRRCQGLQIADVQEQFQGITCLHKQMSSGRAPGSEKRGQVLCW